MHKRLRSGLRAVLMGAAAGVVAFSGTGVIPAEGRVVAPAACVTSGSMTKLKLTPAPIAPFGSLQKGQSAVFAANALSGPNCLQGAHISLNVSSGPGTVFIPPAQCGGATHLSGGAVTCVTDSTGTVQLTYTAPASLPDSGAIEVNASGSGLSDHDWYAYEFLYQFSVSPIAPSGTLTGSQTAPVTLQELGLDGTPTAATNVYLALKSTASPAGTAMVGAVALTSTLHPFATDSSGQIAINFTAPGSPGTSGVDMILASSSTSSAPMITNSTGYAYNSAYPIVSIGDVAQVEGDTHPDVLAEFNVTVSSPQPTPITVYYETVCGLGDKPCKEDYLQSLPGSLRSITIAAGKTRGQINIRIYSYVANEPYDETFNLEIMNPVGALVGRSLGKGVILGDDETTTAEILYVGDASVVRSVTGNQYAELTVTLSSPSGSDVSFQYATADGTALANTDYFAASGTATIAAGLSSTHIQVPILPSTGPGPLTFTVTISNPTGATIERSIGTGTVL